MSVPQRKIDDYVSLKPSRFGRLTRFEWSLVSLDEGYNSHLVVHLSRLGAGTDELILNFKGVQSVQFSPGGLLAVLIAVRDVSDRQWEQVAFEVKDTENDTISFLCHDFSFIVRDIAG